MGYAIGWLAVRGKVPEQVLAELDAAPTGRQLEFGTARLAACRLSTGWFAVVINEAEHPWVGEDMLALLSDGAAEVLACRVEEHVMVSSAELWRSGERQWRVVHDARLGRDHLVAEGRLPAAYAGIAAEHRQLAAAAAGKPVDHVFEVPLKLAQRLVGFKHDEGGAGGEGGWDELRHGPMPEQAPPGPWWKFW
ncbi:hypothetical protein [Ideonella sp.]|uniref:hypothetical protein n=1 Tax=Ideonella sp. TaxID=1929293 RepID=UPI002B4970AE|nr:hypothetical protein [Ideonella sp.]HJV68347.1 hypothetical protein [Ideonella sp.]